MRSVVKSRRRFLYVISLPAAVAVWSGWVGLGGMAGFGVIHPLPGIWDGLRLNTAITLPIGVEAYGAFALTTWLDEQTPERARRFAKRSGIGSLVLGILGQVTYHLLAAPGWVHAPWPVVMFVSCMPVAVVGFSVALTSLLREGESQEQPEPVQGQPGVAEQPAKPVAQVVVLDDEHSILVPPEEPGEDQPESSQRMAEDVVAEWPESELAELITLVGTLSERRLAARVGLNRNQAIKLKRLVPDLEAARDQKVLLTEQTA